MVMAEPLLRLLSRRYPKASIDVLALPHLEPLLARMENIRRVWVAPFKHGKFQLGQRFTLARAIKDEHYDLAIVLPNSWKSALIPFLARIPNRRGWIGEQRYVLLNDLRRIDKKFLSTQSKQYFALGLDHGELLPQSLPQPHLTTNAGNIAATLKKLNLPYPQQPVLALCIGAEYGPAKRWPPAYFAAVAKSKAAEGWEVWLFGGEKDKPIAEEVQKLSQQACYDLTGRTSLAEAVDLLTLCKAAVTNDSGLMHIAAALALPLVAIYGSSSCLHTPPLSTNAHVLTLNLPCSPCFKRICPLGHYKCMLELHPNQVLQALAELT